jgi:hypothetical protein
MENCSIWHIVLSLNVEAFSRIHQTIINSDQTHIWTKHGWRRTQQSISATCFPPCAYIFSGDIQHTHEKGKMPCDEALWFNLGFYVSVCLYTTSQA